jgi:ribulose-5-phosphate 4-epimerase/fuculose-1-phosphate aldolase
MANSPAIQQLFEDLATANQILANEGVFDGFGHISVRNPENPERFFIARSMAPASVTASDIVECDLNGDVHDAQGRKSYLERFIHSAIFQKTPRRELSGAQPLTGHHSVWRDRCAPAPHLPHERLLGQQRAHL